MFEDRLELVRPDGEIKEPIAARPPFLIDLFEPGGEGFESRFVAKIALMVKNRLRESFPDFVADRLAGEFPRCFLELASEFVVVFLASGKTDDRDRGWEFAIGREIVKRGNELSVGRIAGRAENDDAAGLRHGAGGESFPQRIYLRLVSRSVHGIISALHRVEVI